MVDIRVLELNQVLSRLVLGLKELVLANDIDIVIRDYISTNFDMDI